MKIESFITQLCEHCGVPADQVEVTVENKEEEVEITISVPEEDSGIFIGHHGEGIDSIQRIVRILFQNQENEEFNKRMKLNINGYREKREDRLKDLAYSIGNKVLETGKSYTFNSYLPAHERYVIHATLSEEDGFSDLESVSEGTGKSRKLTIRLKQ